MSRKKQVYEKITALYCRISLDDGGDNESMSISNQKIMLRDFAEKHGMFQYEYYVDDGYTGRNFNRPAFQRMIADIEAGKIGCVITKDLSRLGRNYIEAGSYIEIFFPKHNVRYIAITDGVDSLTRQEMDITPFKNILNDMYSRDISKKVLAGITTRSRQGKFCGGTPPFGLMRDPEDKGHLIIDPETAPIIRKIYDYALDGLGCMRISKRLMEEKIPITHVKANTEFDANYYSWGGARISHILRNPFYKGAHLVFRTHQKGIRSNTYDIIPRDQWEVIEGCHEAIVTPEEWEQARRIHERWARNIPVYRRWGDFARQTLMHGALMNVSVTLASDPEVFKAELHHIGVNVNQIARIANLTGSVSPQQMRELHDLLALIDERMTGMEREKAEIDAVQGLY